LTVLPPDEVTFLRVVEQTFLTLKGSGLMLSPKDLERVRGWERSGVPVQVVCSALVESFQSFVRAHGPTAVPPRSLAYCAPAVEEAIAAWRSRMVGRNVPEEEP